MSEQTLGMIQGGCWALSYVCLAFSAYTLGRRHGHDGGYARGLDDGFDEAIEEEWDDGPVDAPSRSTLKQARKLLH